MLYLIGLGLSHDSISKKGLEIAKKCKKVYLENYTVELPYSNGAIEETIGKKVVPADRKFVEDLRFLDEAQKSDIALLVYGSPLTATTHISIIQEAEKRKIKTEVIHNASIFDAVAETGLQLYKFGKIASIPDFSADSYIEIVKDNLSIKAHTLILIDVGLRFEDALEKLEKDSKNKKIKIGNVIICGRLGTKDSCIYCNNIHKLKNKKVSPPFCIIIPGELHFMESEVLQSFNN